MPPLGHVLQLLWPSTLPLPLPVDCQVSICIFVVSVAQLLRPLAFILFARNLIYLQCSQICRESEKISQPFRLLFLLYFWTGILKFVAVKAATSQFKGS